MLARANSEAVFAVAVLVIAWAGRAERFVDYRTWPENVRDNVHYSWNKTVPGRALPDAIANTLQRVAWHLGALALFAGAPRAGKYAPRSISHAGYVGEAFSPRSSARHVASA